MPEGPAGTARGRSCRAFSRLIRLLDADERVLSEHDLVPGPQLDLRLRRHGLGVHLGPVRAPQVLEEVVSAAGGDLEVPAGDGLVRPEVDVRPGARVWAPAPNERRVLIEGPVEGAGPGDDLQV